MFFCSCQSSVRGWSGRRPTDRSCRRSCAASGRLGRSWSAQSPSSSSRWPGLSPWEAAPLLLFPLPLDPLTPTPRLPPSQRPQRLAKSNCHPSRCLPPSLIPLHITHRLHRHKQISLVQKGASRLLRLFLSCASSALLPFYFSVELTFEFYNLTLKRTFLWCAFFIILSFAPAPLFKLYLKIFFVGMYDFNL